MLAGLAAFVGAVYVAVVIVLGLFVGRSDAPSPLLSVVATAIVAVGFQPVRRRLQTLASRLQGRPHPLPYDVLAHFAPDSEASDQETPLWMAKVLTSGVGDHRVHPALAAPGPTKKLVIRQDHQHRVLGD